MSASHDMSSYEQLIEGLNKAVDSVNTRAPTLDLADDVTRYVESLRYVPSEQRRSKIVAFIRPLVDQTLAQWRSSVDHGHGLLVKLHNAIEQIEADKAGAEAAIQTAQARVTQEELRRELLKKKEAQFRKELADIRPVTAFAQWSYRVLVVGSLLVAIVTAWYYLNMQVSIQAARAGQSAVDTLTYLAKHPVDWIYAFGVVIFLLAGKIVSTLYAHLRHPSWMYIIVAIAAVSTTVGSVVIIGSVSDEQQKVAAITQSIEAARVLDEVTGEKLDCAIISSSTSDAIKSTCARIKDLQFQQSAASERIASYSFWMTVVVMLAEILLGAVAWMLASEHHEKHGAERDLVARRLDATASDIKEVESAIETQKETIANAQKARVKADSLINELHALQPRIPGEAVISQTCSAILNEQIQRGEVILAEATHKWKLQESVPPTA